MTLMDYEVTLPVFAYTYVCATCTCSICSSIFTDCNVYDKSFDGEIFMVGCKIHNSLENFCGTNVWQSIVHIKNILQKNCGCLINHENGDSKT